MYNEYQQILQRSVFYVDRIAKCEIGGGPLSLLFTVYLLYLITKCTITEVAYNCVVAYAIVVSSSCL